LASVGLRPHTKVKYGIGQQFTLGDEFQSVIKNLPAALDIIFSIEEKIAAGGQDFRLRYVLEEGKIETPLNRKIAYGMIYR